MPGLTYAVSIGQAGCNALAAWLKVALTTDIFVSDQWPDPDITLQQRTISIIQVGQRQRLDVIGGVGDIDSSQTANESAVFARYAFRIGSYMQPAQLDIWATNTIDRDDAIAQLDRALNTGAADTIGPAVTDDPVRDGVLVPLLITDGYAGNVDCWFDEPVIDDTPAAIQRGEYRATYVGQIRGAFSRLIGAPRLVQANLGLADANGVPYSGKTHT